MWCDGGTRTRTGLPQGILSWSSSLILLLSVLHRSRANRQDVWIRPPTAFRSDLRTYPIVYAFRQRRQPGLLDHRLLVRRGQEAKLRGRRLGLTGVLGDRTREKISRLDAGRQCADESHARRITLDVRKASVSNSEPGGWLASLTLSCSRSVLPRNDPSRSQP